MSTAPVVPTKGKSLLQKFCSNAKSVFAWLTSSKGQQVIQAGEGVAEAIDPALVGLINIANNWMAEILKSETLAAAAGSQDGTGTQKAAMVLSAMTPEVLSFAEQHGLPTPTATQIATASNGLVQFLNALSAKA